MQLHIRVHHHLVQVKPPGFWPEEAIARYSSSASSSKVHMCCNVFMLCITCHRSCVAQMCLAQTWSSHLQHQLDQYMLHFTCNVHTYWHELLQWHLFCVRSGASSWSRHWHRLRALMVRLCHYVLAVCMCASVWSCACTWFVVRYCMLFTFAVAMKQQHLCLGVLAL